MSSTGKGIRWIFRVYKIFVLDKDYSWETKKYHFDDKKIYEFRDKKKNKKLRMTISKGNIITVKAGYAWDGCTPKFSFLDLLVIGTPDGILSDKTGKPKAYHASLVHDVLYQFLPDLPPDNKVYTREMADGIFLEILEDADFALRKLYYYAVRTFGGFFAYTRKHITRKTEGEVRVKRQKAGSKGTKREIAKP